MMKLRNKRSTVELDWRSCRPAGVDRAAEALCCTLTPQPTPDIMASKNLQVFNDLNFDQEVVKAPGKVLVDFTATWCGPCKRLAPIVDELAELLEGKVKVGKLDIDEAPMTASKFQVRGVPTLMVFEGGQPVQTSVGLVSKAKVLSLLGES